MMQQPGSGMAPPSQQPPMGMGPPHHQYPQHPHQPHPYAMNMMPPGPHPHQIPQQSMWPQQHYQQANPSSVSSDPDEVRSLWIGDLQYWMDENFIASCFAPHTNEISNIKVIRNRWTGSSEGYGFVEFTSRATAERILQTYNGAMMPNLDQPLRLNWASHSGGDKRDEGPEYTIFVGDLAADVTDQLLQDTFKVHYTSVKGAKVVLDRMTQRTKGYGFVRFGDENEQVRAMTEMNGQYCSSRPMRIGLAANKKSSLSKESGSDSVSQSQSEQDPSNTTIFVGNLDSNATDDDLRSLFGRCGQLVHVKIPAGKRCGFVQYAERRAAEDALENLNGAQLCGQSIRLSWGRNFSNKQSQQEANQWNGGYYGYGQGYGQGYEGYGYGGGPQDPSMYYGGYGGYGAYQQPQQQPPHQQVGYS